MTRPLTHKVKSSFLCRNKFTLNKNTCIVQHKVVIFYKYKFTLIKYKSRFYQFRYKSQRHLRFRRMEKEMAGGSRSGTSYEILFVPHRRAYTHHNLDVYFLPLARLFFLWPNFSFFGATFFLTARLFFYWHDFFSDAHLWTITSVGEQEPKMALEKASTYLLLNTSVFMSGWGEGSSSIPIRQARQKQFRVGPARIGSPREILKCSFSEIHIWHILRQN